MSSLYNLSFLKIWKPAAIFLAVAFVFAAVFSKLGKDCWSDENYSHGLLVPFVILMIIWTDFDRLRSVVKRPSPYIGAPIIFAAILLLFAGTLGAELFTQRIAFLLMTAGIVVYFWGANLLKIVVVPFLLFLMAIPIPQIIFNKIAFPLQIWASQLAIWGVRLFEVASVRKGNVIEILPRGATQIVALEVVEACSGIRSLMTLVTLALVMWYFTRGAGRRDWIRAAILMAAAVPIAIITNAGRVTATGVMTYYYGKQSADGFTHEFSGWLVYLAAFILLFAVNYGLTRFQPKPEGMVAARPESLLLNRPIRTAPVLFLASFLFFSGIFVNWFQTRPEIAVDRRPLKEVSNQLGGWRMKGNDIRFSEQTESVLRASDYVMREYEGPAGDIANLYVGYYSSQRTGATFHSPQNCMPGSGWELKSPETVEIIGRNGTGFMANRYIVENGGSRQVLIYWYQGRGRSIGNEFEDKAFTIFDSVTKRRSDGAMVRIMLPVGNSESAALQSAVDLSAQIADVLPTFVPD